MELKINGQLHSVTVDPERTLLSVLRDELNLTGAKYGCGEGQCGACTVLMNGAPVRSCRTPVRVAAGKPITTIEGIETHGSLHPLQQAFLDADALQCGYCTPGMVMAAVGLLDENPSPSEAEVRRALEGNLCRCTGYHNIVRAVLAAAEV